MTENGNQDIDIAQLMARIRESAEKRKSDSVIDAAATLYDVIKSNRRQEGELSSVIAASPLAQTKFETRERYRLEDLTAYDGSDFVRNAYQAVLRREPDDQGFAYFANALRSGRLEKTEILAKLKYSPEGQLKNVPVDGLTKLSLLRKIHRVPVIGYVVELIVGIFGLPSLMAEQRRLAADFQDKSRQMSDWFTQQINRSDDRVNDMAATFKKASEFHQQQLSAVTRELNDFIEDQNRLKKNISDQVSATQELFRQQNVAQELQDDELQRLRELLETRVIRRVQQTRMSLVQQERRLLLLLEETRKQVPGKSGPDVSASEEIRMLDSLYASLEDDFRGTREEIKESLGIYIPILQKHKVSANVLDVGCGRGEWLEVLRDNGVAAKGVDSNQIVLEYCRQAALDVTEADAITFLKSQPNSSLTCITAFHFVEHLPLEKLVLFFDECARALTSGGLAIFETPNPENLMVGACNFYLDPTHRHPIPATTLKFLLEARGFMRVETMPLHPPTPRVISGDDPLAKQLNEKLFGPMDYAVIAHKA